MSEQLAVATTPATPGSPADKPHSADEHDKQFLIHAFWKFALIISIIMVVLAPLGVGLTTTNRDIARTYWVCLVPVYGLLCIGTAWRRARMSKHPDQHIVVVQVFHWLGVAVAVGLDFFVRRTGEETGVAAGENALLLLALGCYLAGVHMERLFIFVGVLLTVVVIFVAKVDQYLWLMFVVGGLVVVAMGAAWWLIDRHSRRLAAARRGVRFLRSESSPETSTCAERT